MTMNGTVNKQAVDEVFGPVEPENASIVLESREIDESEEPLSLDRPNIQVDMSVKLRMSAIGECLRRLAYQSQGIEETDEIPIENQGKMLAGTYLEPMVKEMLRRDGWTVREESAVAIPYGWVTLTGHPDGIVVPPAQDVKPAILEVKVRDDSLARFAWKVGVERTHPETVQQAALYSMAVFGQVGDLVIATMARDSVEYKAERIPAFRAQKAFNDAVARVDDVVSMVFRREIPEPTLPAGDAHCRSCPFRSLCGNAEKDVNPGVGGMSDEEVNEQLQAWANATANAPKTTTPESKAKRAASDALKAHFIAIDSLENELEVEGQKYRLKVTPKPGVDIDMEAFNELVDPEIREQVVIEKVTHSMRITPIKPKKAPAKRASAKQSGVDAAGKAKEASAKEDTADEASEK